ncbi:hypothetical protein TNCV_1409621 [Trichonephila clavipes]|uniref:Uncharacterized protein n=1 Tax=Trichonephila clavipes TaxID=2585209 RepID=A0A8X6R271_TRICX|nr:hypothetical protein TNCV_1409621 [Trichonephila clavipes]
MEKRFLLQSNSSNFDHQEEMWCPNDMLESLKLIQLQNMFNMCSIDINNVLKEHYSVFNGSAKQLTMAFSLMAYNASFQIKSSPNSSAINKAFRNPHKQKSHGLKSGGQEDHASGKCLDIT